MAVEPESLSLVSDCSLQALPGSVKVVLRWKQRILNLTSQCQMEPAATPRSHFDETVLTFAPICCFECVCSGRCPVASCSLALCHRELSVSQT